MVEGRRGDFLETLCTIYDLNNFNLFVFSTHDVVTSHGRGSAGSGAVRG